MHQTAALALVGNTLTSNIYLDIPPLIRGLQHFLLCANTNATQLKLSQEILTTLHESKPDPKNPSSAMEEYVYAWWTKAGDWQNQQHQLFNIDAAFAFHFDKVS